MMDALFPQRPRIAQSTPTPGTPQQTASKFTNGAAHSQHHALFPSHDDDLRFRHGPGRTTSDDNTTSSRFSTPEPRSEHQAGGTTITPIIVPPSPPAVPLDRSHTRAGSAHVFVPPHDLDGFQPKHFHRESHSLDTPPSSRTRPGDPGPSTGRYPGAPIPPPPEFTHPPPPWPPPSWSGTSNPSSRNEPPPPPPPPPNAIPQPTSRDGRRLARQRKKPMAVARYNEWTRPSSSTSSSGSALDEYAERNRRIFPPVFPTESTYQATAPNRSDAIHKITNWVTAHERGQRSSRDLLVQRPKLMQSNLSASPPASVEDMSDSEESMSTDSPGMEIEQLWQLLKEKRSKVASIKQDMAARRKELRVLRRKRDDADNSMMNLLRPVLVNHRSISHISASALSAHLGEVQSLWGEYTHLEATYEGQELLLDEEEETLYYAETRFFTILASGRTKLESTRPAKKRPLEASYPTNVPLDLRGISPEGPTEDLHPCYVRLTSTYGDLQNAIELHEELMADKKAHEEDAEVRQATGRQPHQETKEFWATFDEEQERLHKAVVDLERQTEDLKQYCQSQGLMRKHMSIEMEYALDPTIRYDNLELDDVDTIVESQVPLTHGRFPELLSDPQHVLAENFPVTSQQALERAQRPQTHTQPDREHMRRVHKEFAIERLFVGGKEELSKPELVNRWLLQSLRLSPFEAALLYETFLAESRLKIRDTWRWQHDVLHYWFRDMTMLVRGSYDGESQINHYGSNRLVFATPPRSRAASDHAAMVRSSADRVRDDSSDAKTVQGDFYKG